MSPLDADRLEQVLEAQARARPGATAVVCGRDQLTYAELDRGSAALARRLVASGVRPKDRVGLYASKGVGAVAALFGVLKAGAAYVPLDSTGPLARALQIAGQSGARVLLTGSPQQRKLQAAPELLQGAGLELLPISEALEAPGPGAPALPRGLVGGPGETAYILYTSGSTGTPKGVAVSHASALYFTRWAARQVGLGPGDRCSNHAPLFFDLSVFDVHATLLAGGAVVVIPPAYSAFPRSLAGYLEQQRITVWYSVPPTLLDLLQGGDLPSRDLSALRAVIFAGEVFPVAHLRRLMELLPGRVFFNFYGPTETNVCAAHRLDGPPPADAAEVPIGRICEGLEGRLVGPGDQPLEGPGRGELWIRGPAVMQGYFGMPRETAAAMVPATDGGPWYRTGDLVRADADGLLTFVGRKDGMVKVGGYRVELGDLEAALGSLPGVAEACATAPRDADGKRLLAAFVALEQGAAGGAEELLAALQERLPRYMLPAHLTLLERLPRTPNGKIDRARLEREAAGAGG